MFESPTAATCELEESEMSGSNDNLKEQTAATDISSELKDRLVTAESNKAAPLGEKMRARGKLSDKNKRTSQRHNHTFTFSLTPSASTAS